MLKKYKAWKKKVMHTKMKYLSTRDKIFKVLINVLDIAYIVFLFYLVAQMFMVAVVGLVMFLLLLFAGSGDNSYRNGYNDGYRNGRRW